MSGRSNVAPAGGSSNPVGYLWCCSQGTVHIRDWLWQEGLEYEVFYAGFLRWCQKIANRWRAHVDGKHPADAYTVKAAEDVLWAWPAPASPKLHHITGKPVLGMICLMKQYLQEEYSRNDPNNERYNEEEILKLEEFIYNTMFTDEDRKKMLEDHRLFEKPARQPFALSRSTKDRLAKKEAAAMKEGMGFASTFGAALPSGKSAQAAPATAAPAFAGPSSLPFRARGQGPVALSSTAPAPAAPPSFPLHIKGQGPVALAARDDDEDDDDMID